MHKKFHMVPFHLTILLHIPISVHGFARQGAAQNKLIFSVESFEFELSLCSSCHQTDNHWTHGGAKTPETICKLTSVLKSIGTLSKFSVLTRGSAGEEPTCSDGQVSEFVDQLCFHEHRL